MRTAMVRVLSQNTSTVLIVYAPMRKKSAVSALWNSAVRPPTTASAARALPASCSPTSSTAGAL